MDYRVHMRKKRLSTDITLMLVFEITGIITAINAFMGYSVNGNNAVAIITLALSVYLCKVYRFNIGLFLVMLFIAYTNFSIVLGVYLVPSIRPNFIYRQFTSSATFGIGITCIYIFEILTLLFSRNVIKNPHSIDFKNEDFINNFENNSIIAIGAPIIYIIIFAISFRMGVGDARGGSSALNEYRTVIAIIGCYYCGRKKVYKYIWSIIIGITSFLILLSGNRIDMFGSMIFLIFFWYANVLNYKKALTFFPIAVVFLTAVGFLRGSISLNTLSISSTVHTLFGDGLTYEGALYGYVPSLAIVELAGKTSLAEKLDLLWNHIVYTFTVGVAGGNNPDLSNWSRSYYTHWWGFISPTYFYFWMGYFGAVAYAILVNTYNRIYQKLILKKIHKFEEKVGYILSLYFIANVARWYAYGPMGLLRGMFVCFIVFCIVYAFDTVTRRKTSKEGN